MRPSISSNIKSQLTKAVRPGGNLPWSYSVLTTTLDSGKIIFPASTAYALNSAGAISLWFKTSNSVATKVFLELYTSVNDRTGLYYSGNVLVATSVKGGSIMLNNITGYSNDGNWHHYVLTYDANSYVVYVDSVAVATFVNNYTLTLTNPQLVVSGALSTTGFPIQGNICGVGLYASKLTATQVSGLYRANQQPASCVARWDFEKGTGTSIVPTFGPQATTGTLGTGDTWANSGPPGKTRLITSGIFAGE